VADCTHLDQITVAKPDRSEVEGCEECLKIGATWVHLRVCRTCGKIGCCDSSPNRHATAHVQESDHPIVSSLEPGEDWTYCYVDDVAFIVDDAARAN
jgi:uncharacterized UBP type Zn finger protein